jgi:hypothetical protein
MLTRERLNDAVAIHEACYALLKWAAAAVDRDFVAVQTAHTYMSEAEAAAGWIGDHYENLPADCRPAGRSGEPLRRFANYFSSYLTSSFDLQDSPGVMLVGGCPCCHVGRYLVNAPRLKPKKLRSADKKRAQKLKRDYLEELALQAGVNLSDAASAALLGGEATRRDVALAAYGSQLLRRCDGHSSTPAVLALWREVAWESGAPRRGFQLTAEGILEAEKRLAAALTRDRSQDAGV